MRTLGANPASGILPAALWALGGIAAAGCDPGPSRPPAANPWAFPDTAAAVALFQVDLQTNRFEGGILRTFAAEPDSGSPFVFTYRPPGDFGWSLIRYAATADTLFFGETIWSGSGDRQVPPALLPPGRFATISGPLPALAGLEYLLPSAGNFPDLESAQRAADTAWATVMYLDLAKAFGGRRPRAAILLYSRREGEFDPAGADWIVMLYGGRR